MILSFITYFDINQRKFRIQDTTNYAGQGSDINNIKGILKLTTPRGVVYNTQTYTTPDVTPATSLYSPWIPLPQNQAGFILAGSYSVQYSVQDVTTISTQTNNYTYSFIVPEIIITQTPDGYNSTFESRDDTVYGAYTSLIRTHTVIPSSGSPLSTTSNSNQTIDYSPNIWSGEWASTVTSVLVYTMGDGLIINVNITDTQTITAFNIDMNQIRGYIEVLRLRYFTALTNDRDEAYRLKDRLLLIGASYSEYDLAIYYNDLATAYNKAVDIITQLNDVITITFPEEVIPFSSHGSGTTHLPVSINPTYAFGTTINVNQVLSFGLATILNGGMLKQLSGNVTDYMGGDGNWHTAGMGDVLKTDFTAFDSVRAITATNITHWESAYGLVGNVYTKTNLQISGQAQVHFDNLINKPTTLSGYGITNGVVSNVAITGATHTKITYDSKGLVTAGVDLSASDIPSLDWSKITSGIPTTISGYGITDAYTKTQVDAKTWDWTTKITGKPTTLLGYGITDALSTSSAAGNVIKTGLGTQFLADDGNYKYVTLHNTSDKQVVFINGAATEGSNNFIYDKYTSTLYTQHQIAGIVQIFDEIDFIGASGSGSGSGFRHWGDVKLYRTANDLVLKDHHYTKTLSQLVSGATNFWSQVGSTISYGTGTNRVGINQTVPSSELDVVGHITANYFDSSFFRYENSNLLLGPNAGDLETGSNLLYIANSNTATPLIYGDFLNQQLIFNSDVYINTIKRLAFGSSDVYIHRTSGNDLEFSDPNANGGVPITLSQLTTLTGYALKSDFTQYSAVTTITAANKITWNKASILNTGGSASNFLGEDGLYHAGGGGGVTPTDGILKFDLGSVLYRPYTDKTEAGGVSSAGKFYLSTSTPTATNRLNYDGILFSTGITVVRTDGQTGISSTTNGRGLVGVSTGTDYGIYGQAVNNAGVCGSSSSGIGVLGQSDSSVGLYGQSGTNRALYLNNLLGNTSSLISAGVNYVEKFSVDKDGNVNIPTGSSYKVNGIPVIFPGFGTNHTTAAYGDHTHTGVYEPILGNPIANNYMLISTTGGGRSWVPATMGLPINGTGLTSTAISLAGGATSTLGIGILDISNDDTFGWGIGIDNVGSATGMYIINEGVGTGLAIQGSSGTSLNIIHQGTANGLIINSDDTSTGTAIDINMGYAPAITPFKLTKSISGPSEVTLAEITNTGKISYAAGTSTTLVRVPGVLKDFYTDVSTSGTGETDLYSYTVPANVLASDGDKLSVYITVDSSTTTGLINFYFAGTSISIGSLTAITGRTIIEAELIRTSSSTLRGSIKTLHVLNNYIFDLTSKDWTIDNILKITGTASIGTFTAKFGYIEYKPAAL